MKSIIAKVNFTLNGRFYTAGKEVKVDRIEEAIKLNELGFIEPLSKNDIEEIRADLTIKIQEEQKRLEEESRKKEE